MRSLAKNQLARRVFLSAEWRDLAILNYELEPGILAKYTPRGTEPDSFGGKTYVSLVGFRFLSTRMYGRFAIPFHTDFEEVNLRFYVRRRDGLSAAGKRGVVFIREIVPRRAIAWLARAAYGESYVYGQMRHGRKLSGTAIEASYEWLSGKRWCGIHVETAGEAKVPSEGSLGQFITDHHWGYAAQRDGGCFEYEVKHEPWRVWNCGIAKFHGDVVDLYGRELARVLKEKPVSAFLAEGSAVEVLPGRKIS